MYGRNRNGEFGTEASARKFLARGMDRIRAHYNRWEGENSKHRGEEEDQGVEEI
jgi:hypothetical protein